MDESEVTASSLQSLQHIRPSELYPKCNAVSEIQCPFNPLCGEYVSHLGQTANGTLALSNYRLYHQHSSTNQTFHTIPLGLIEQIECKDILYLHISCKDGQLCRLRFVSSELCAEWLRRLTKATSPAKSVEDVFAFALYAWADEEASDELMSRLSRDSPTVAYDNFKNEMERLQFDVSAGGPWRVSMANADYKLCPTYPRQLLVPACITDQSLDAAAKFRSTRRVPAVVWRHGVNGAVIARCSQPEVGWLGWRSSDDEQLLKAIADSCAQNSQPKKLLIMDARSYTTAVANRARGGGCECPEYYPNCEIQFMSLANIHAIRKSFAALRTICCPVFDQPNWFSLLEGTRWLQNMSGLLHAAVTVAGAIETGRPVLVHCSDGWDRTPQIVSLAQLLLDPYYRTVETAIFSAVILSQTHRYCCGRGRRDRLHVCLYIMLRIIALKMALCNETKTSANNVYSVRSVVSRSYPEVSGFRVLVSREWLEFGHKFADRCGHTEDANERCPVFLQWLDCVHNIIKQFPCAFQLNSNYLVKLAQHTYSNMFGTFLCNNSRERSEMNVSSRTFSVWSLLQSAQYINHLYCSQQQVLWPSCNIRDLELWRELYLGTSSVSNNLFSPQDQMFPLTHQDSNANVEAEFMNGEDLNGNGEEQNGHLEEFNCSKSEKNKCDDDDQTVHDSLDKMMRTSWKESYSQEVSSVVESQDNEEADGWKSPDGGQQNTSTERSVESSTETLISPNNYEEPLPNGQHSEQNQSTSSPTYGRQVPAPALLDPVDGLTPLKDDIQQRLTQMALEHKAKEIALERELYTTRLALLQKVCHQCTVSHSGHPTSAPLPLPERPDDDGSVCSTEVSWEAVEERETMPVPTLWVPDHAVSHCMGCHNQFWLGRRKHHCRSCGNIFCADCSENAVALPEEQLYAPVRVCTKCFNNPQAQTCKQAAQTGQDSPTTHTHAHA